MIDGIQCSIPDISVVRDVSGEAVYDQSGELVCTKPFPCMPIYFWNDPQGLKYKKAYFKKFAGER